MTTILKLIIFAPLLLLLEKNTEKELENSMKKGAIIYKDFCVNCHKSNGEGTNLIPPLANSDYLLTKRVLSIKAIKFGQKGEIIVNGKKYNSAMATMGLLDQEVADVMNYILNKWGNSSTKLVTKEEVQKLNK
ncbi:cytochrome c [Ancylomarina sp. DW003]|nr:cytochrome c [Ancylomarina sp. DW003]MDE5423887.1 cytochrome c [Ancylomarina sp. DW003]